MAHPGLRQLMRHRRRPLYATRRAYRFGPTRRACWLTQAPGAQRPRSGQCVLRRHQLQLVRAGCMGRFDQGVDRRHRPLEGEAEVGGREVVAEDQRAEGVAGAVHQTL